MDSNSTANLYNTQSPNRVAEGAQLSNHTTKSTPNLSAGDKLAAELREFQSVATELRSQLASNAAEDVRRNQVIQTAAELFGLAPTWVAFYREVMGPQGVMRYLFESNEAYAAFEKTNEYMQVLEMLTTLRSRDLPENDPSEAQRMITVRIPKSMHDSICDEANRLQVSVNKLCISRMVQLLDERMIPSSQQKRRGRKPGAAQATASASATTLSEESPNLAPMDTSPEM